MEPKQAEAYQRKTGQLQQAIEERRHQIGQLRIGRQSLAKHIEIKELPDRDPFHRLRPEKKHLSEQDLSAIRQRRGDANRLG